MKPSLPLLASPVDVAERLGDARLVSVELMYRSRPTMSRERRVFDYALASRLAELSRHAAAVFFICNNEATVSSLAHLPAAYPRVMMLAALANPQPVAAAPSADDTEIPFRCDWPDPGGWRQYMMTDRWARIGYALNVAARLTEPGYLILTAHDAIWGRGLLRKLLRFSHEAARNGLPAAVSPFTPYHHSSVPGVDIPQPIIDALNAAWSRDTRLRRKLQSGDYQGFWGKTGLLPFALCEVVLRDAGIGAWEDDLEIDRALRAAGYATRSLWIDAPARYRQALPVFDRAGLRRVIERTLHYSLPIPGAFPGATSLLNQPLDAITRRRLRLSPRFARAVALSEQVIAECNAEIAARVKRYGWSWVDWGAYRHAIRPGDPWVRVWKHDRSLL